MRERERKGETDRQTDRDTETDKQVQRDRVRDRHRERGREGERYRQAGRQADRQRNDHQESLCANASVWVSICPLAPEQYSVIHSFFPLFFQLRLKQVLLI